MSLLKSVGKEMKKVRWGKKKEMIGYRMSVILRVVLFGMFLCFVD
ncbi:preprotein translocase subunit SecE, partial [Bacillus pumilus]